MEAGKRTINDIFNGNRILEIPFFQRAYEWGEVQWERLLEDMEQVSASNKPYFLGSIILKQKPTESQGSRGDLRTVVDGQQRLTTLNIFFKSLCQKLGNDTMFDRVFKLINNEVALLHNHNDIDNFNKILELTEENALDGDDNISMSYNYFRENIDIQKLDFQNILSNLMFVGIDLGADEDEQQIFDTINSLGVGLTTAELLKNFFFGRDDLEAYENNWKTVFEADLETKEFWDKEITSGRMRRSNIDLFFYSFLQIRIQDPSIKVSSDDKKSFNKVDGLFESFKNFIKDYNIEKEEIIKEIKEYAELYKAHIDPGAIERELPNQYGLDRINVIIFGLENTTLIPYILYILKNVRDNDVQTEIFGYLEAYIMRRMICRTTNKNYNQLFADRLISNAILTKKQLSDYINNLSDKSNYLPSDSELKKGFHNSKLINKQSAGIIYFIESVIRDRNNHSTSLLGLNRYSLEHLMPKKWENHWGKLASEEDRIKRNRTLLTLGNLAIITASLNSSIRDSGWGTKKKGKKGKKGLKQYSAGIETLVNYLDLPIWDEATIEQRADYLYEHATSIWTSY
jgi:hypothetical protein